MAKFEPRPFGKYFLTDCIAIGGMAEIYKAKTFGVDGFEKVLAIKKILSHYSADKEFITMLTDEAKLVVNLSHANIVQVYDLGRVSDDYFISMEFIDGINLRDLVEKSKELGEKIPDEICIYIASEICKGLDYAHNKKDTQGAPLQIVHRDISPQNILVSFDGGVKIVDFGIAKAAMNLSQTHIGTLKGKVTYMAPEQAFGKPIDGRTDLFSLGIVLHEILSLERFFTGDSQMEILKKIRNTSISKDTLKGTIPDVLIPILAKALAYKVNDRFQNASDMQVELTKVLYSHYPDFSPRKLAELLHRWFAHDEAAPDIPEDPEGEILVSSQTAVVPIEDKALDETGFAETLGPEQGLTHNDFTHDDDIENTEKTEKSEVTSPNESVEGMLARKQKQRKLLRNIIILLLLLGLMGWAWAKWKDVEESDSTPVSSKTVQDTPILPVDKKVATPPQKMDFKDLSLQTIPDGAQIFIDGKESGLVTPAKLEQLKIGQVYQIKFVKEGFLDLSQELTISQKSDDTYKYRLDPAVFSLNVISTPAGADISLNGQSIAQKTPFVLKDLKLGQKYELLLQKEKFKNLTQEFVYTDPQDQELSLTLEPVPLARLELNSQPNGAKILLAGKDTGFVTPYVFENLNLSQSLSLSLQKEGYENWQETIRIENLDQKRSAKLKKKPEPIKDISIRVTSNIKGADVIVDGVHKGKTPLTLSVQPGSHKIYVKKSKYKTASRSLSVSKAHKNKSFYFKLSAEIASKPVETTSSTTAVNPTTPPTTTSTANVAAVAKLRVDSSPRGASVKVNGSPRGITPIMISNLPKNKSLTVTVSKPGYKTWSRSLRLNRDRTEVKANLSR